MSRIPEEVIQQVKDNADIVKVAQDFLGKDNIKKRGSNFQTLCPFHEEKTPSFNLNSSRQIFHCFGCGVGGNVYSLVMRYSGLSFPDSVRYVTNKYVSQFNYLVGGNKYHDSTVEEGLIEFNLNSPDLEQMIEILQFADEFYKSELFTNHSAGAKRARKYLESRGIDKGLIERIGVGFAPRNDILISRILSNYDDKQKGFQLIKKAGLLGSENYSLFLDRVTFPICNFEGTVVGYNARLTTDKKDQKYKNSPQCEIFSKSHFMYGLNFCDREAVKNEGLFLVEGYTDLFGFLIQDMNCSLTLGSTSLTADQCGVIDAFKPKDLYLITDGDKAGIQGAIRNANRIAGTFDRQKHRVKIVSMPLDKDPFDLFFKQGLPIREYVAENAKTPAEFLFSVDRSDLKSTGYNPNSFLEDHTFYIVKKDELLDRGYFIEDQRESHFDLNRPHEFIIKELKK